MAKYVSSKFIILSVTFIGIMYQVDVVDGLRCIVCVPQQNRVEISTKQEADLIKREIYSNYGYDVRECTHDFQFQSQILSDSAYTKYCTGAGEIQYCYKYSVGNWSARTCRNKARYEQGCTSINRNNFHCYCNNHDNCNSVTGLHSTIMNVIYAIISAFALNKFT